MPMMTRVREMPSTQRTTPAVSPCRAFVEASFGGGWSDMLSLNASVSHKVHGSRGPSSRSPAPATVRNSCPTPSNMARTDPSRSAPRITGVTVRDYGPGIPVNARSRIFGRFERAVGPDERRSGFGVGLWVVGQLVNAMGGTIRVDDAPGGG